MTKVRALITIAALATSCVAWPQAPASTPGSQTPAQTQTQTPVLEESYQIQAEDTLSITVSDVPDSSGDFLVGKDGKINVPLAGELDVVGKTRKEIADLLVDKLKKEVKNPRVTVNVKATSIRRIYTMGAIRTPGVLDWKPQWRLTELIAAAGGLSGSPERTKVLIFRKGADHIEIPMRKLLVDGDDKSNVEVLPNDVVNFQTDVQVRVQVVGQVGHQGLVEVLEGQGVAEVLAAAGGASEDARLTGSKILRKGKEIPVDLYKAVKRGDPSVNVTVEEGDTLIVPSLLNKIAVIGMVGKPGPIVIPDGEEMTLTKAVALAGGPIREAKTDSIAVVRMGTDHKPVATKYDLKQLLKADKQLQDPVLQDGDLVVIAQSGKAKLNDFSGAFGVFSIFSRLFPFFP